MDDREVATADDIEQLVPIFEHLHLFSFPYVKIILLQRASREEKWCFLSPVSRISSLAALLKAAFVECTLSYFLSGPY